MQDKIDFLNTAVIYEVNLNIRRHLYDKHKNWLFSHFKDMVNLNGFIKADIYNEINLNPVDDSLMRFHRLTIRYYVNSLSELKSYLDLRAKQMRDQVFEKLGEGYEVSRRVFAMEESSI